jgi:hypothetical protein
MSSNRHLAASIVATRGALEPVTRRRRQWFVPERHEALRPVVRGEPGRPLGMRRGFALIRK